MDPNVQSGLNAILHRLDAIDARWEQWFTDVESDQQRLVAESGTRFDTVELREAAIEERVDAIESFCAAQTSVNVAADDWGGPLRPARLGGRGAGDATGAHLRLGDLGRTR